ncbi:MAG TPA: HAMP domain-containing sensor histidine kinase [Clostridia bacterium]
MKFYSIRFKLFLSLSSLIILFIAISGLLNNLFLQKFYLYEKNNILRSSLKDIDGIYKGKADDIQLELEKIESTKGLHIMIIGSDYQIKYNSVPRDREVRLPMRPERSVMPRDWQAAAGAAIKAKIDQIKDRKPIIETRKDDRLNSYFIRLYSFLGNGDYIVIDTPVAAIQESVSITNSFFIITGIIIIVIGFVIVFIITGSFTRPILALKEIAQKMSTLNFDTRYKVVGRDEIGQLGESINSLSEQLQKSILELQNANAQLMEDIKQKELIDEMRKDFISSVSHELKTPIALIQGYAMGLKLNINKDEESKNFYCDVIIDEGVKINKLVKQLLELSQIESGMAEPEISQWNLNELIEQSLKKNEIIFKNKNINTVFEKGEELTAKADFDRMEQVFTNYISNAVNHVDEKKLIKISIKKEGTKAKVTVFNSGQNIKEDNIDKIWTSFYKVDKARTRAYGGTGLGLSIVRAIQEMHHNKYGVMNVTGGVEFWFELDVV